MQKLLPLFFPRHCPVCNKLVPYCEYIHPLCRQKLPYIRGPVCFTCGKPISKNTQELCYDCRVFPKSFRGGRSLFLYNNISRPLMSSFKYKNKRILTDFFTKELLVRYENIFRQWGVEAVIPVPIHKNKQKKRGYNQAAVLGNRLACSLNLPSFPDFLVRSVDTLPQKQFSPQARLNNLKKAFRLNPRYEKKIKTLHCVLLVDDIYTTGATMEACTRILHEAGISTVYILSVCIGVSRD